MNYSGMSDDKINLYVFEIFFGKLGEDKDMVRVWQKGKFQPCNSWADAGPIIEKYGIGLKRQSNGVWVSTQPGGLWPKYHENPLRAAMIVFLMMQEKPDAA